MPLLSDAATSGRRRRIWAGLWMHRPSFRYLALFYVAYVWRAVWVTGWRSYRESRLHSGPQAGVFVATLLLNPGHRWPWWVVAGCCAELTCNAVWFHNPIPFALVYYTANALEALTAAWLIRRFAAKPFRFKSLEEVLAFVALGAGVAPMVGATVIAVTDAMLGKHPFTTTWPLVWLGDGTGLLISTPLTLVAAQIWRARAKIPRRRIMEAAVLVAALLGIGVLSFSGYLPTAYDHAAVVVGRGAFSTARRGDRARTHHIDERDVYRHRGGRVRRQPRTAA